MEPGLRPLTVRRRFLATALVENVLLAVAGSIAVFVFVQTLTRVPGREPDVVLYFAWMARMIRGDWGVSTTNAEPVAQAIAEGLWPTLELVLVAFVVAFAVGACVGIVRARVRQNWFSASIEGIDLLARSIPTTLLIVSVQLFFLLWVRWPTAGMSSGDLFTLGDHLRHLAVPVLVIAIPFAAWASCVFRDFFLDQKRTRFSMSDVVIPISVCLATLGPALVGAALITEGYFAWPGVGRVLMNGIRQWDVPLTSVLFLLFGGLALCMNLAAALLIARNESVDDFAMSESCRSRVQTPFGANKLAVICLVFLGILGALAALSYGLPGIDGYTIDQTHWMGTPLAPGVGGHVLGTDENGRDLLSRLILSVRTSLALAIESALVATAVGFVLGILARRLLGDDDDRARAVAGARPLGAFPLIVLPVLLLFVHHLRGNVVLVAFVIGVASSPAMVSAFRSRAAASLRRIFAALAGVTSGALLLQVVLATLGYILDPPVASLGNMLENTMSFVPGAPWILACAGGSIVAICFALNAVSDGLSGGPAPAPMNRSARVSRLEE